MLTFDSVRLRLDREQPLTFLEFNYMILQSYDFRELFRRHGVLLQMGGSDQWGNIVSGIDLVPPHRGAHVFGLTTPLITTASGAKMGKTAAGRGLARPPTGCRPMTTGSSGATPKMPMSAASCACSPTCRWTKSPGSKPWRARRSTRPRKPSPPKRPPCCTAAQAAETAAETARRTFEEGDRRRRAAAVSIPAEGLADGLPAFRLFVLAGLAASNAEARRLVRGGGARLNDDPVTDEGQVVTEAALRAGVKVSSGRKHHRLLRVSPE